MTNLAHHLRMRPVLLLALACAVGCGRAPNVSIDDRVLSVEALVASHPLAPGANIRADELGRTPGGSVHLVQIRDGETPHRHASHDLTVTVVRGVGVLTVGGARWTMRRGDVANIARGTPHWFVNTGRAPAVAIVVFAPPLDAPDSVPVDVRVDSPASAR